MRTAKYILQSKNHVLMCYKSLQHYSVKLGIIRFRIYSNSPSKHSRTLTCQDFAGPVYWTSNVCYKTLLHVHSRAHIGHFWWPIFERIGIPIFEMSQEGLPVETNDKPEVGWQCSKVSKTLSSTNYSGISTSQGHPRQSCQKGTSHSILIFDVQWDIILQHVWWDILCKG